jgi:hypothetical protein
MNLTIIQAIMDSTDIQVLKTIHIIDIMDILTQQGAIMDTTDNAVI